MEATSERATGRDGGPSGATDAADARVAIAAPDTDSALRCGDAQALARDWEALRSRLLNLWRAYEQALPASMEIRYAPELNPPRWELGHIGWFEEHWIARNPARLQGWQADPEAPRAAASVRQADALYNSSRVTHTRRWHLDLPDARQTLRQVRAIHERTLALLSQTDGSDRSLYVYRLAALHEAMHAEAWVMMAQQLAIDLRGCGIPLQPRRVAPLQALELPACRWRLGRDGPGFDFDNERSAHEVEIQALSIDSAPVSWGRYLPFVEGGGYDERRWWSDEGWAWRRRPGNGKPRHLMNEGGAWQRALFGQWAALDPDEPAVHLSAHEAQAWCRWAGRRLPTEAEWECAAVTLGQSFAWGQVWEWTASPFAPYPGFEPHPYRDYSQPWFDGRPVLRGASFATWPGLVDARYRNFFTAERSDILAGFRSCAM